MIFKTIFSSVFLALVVFFSGCSKDLEEYNKPAIYWYSKLISSVSNYNLDKADDYYSSLQGEHIGSPLLPEATLILATAHMRNSDYILAEHFLDEYIKRYANDNEKEYAEYMKIKAKYFSLPNPRRDQVLIIDAIAEANEFKLKYPRSVYYHIVDTMLSRFYLGEASLNRTISELYTRLDKPKAALYYKELNPQPWINWSEIQRAQNPWYREWFEGNGRESWYAFLVPDTQSVVSRNSIQDENETLYDNSEDNTTEI